MGQNVPLDKVFIETFNPQKVWEGCWEHDEESDSNIPFWYLAFHKIPYAQPPIGERRFQPPEPYEFFPTNEDKIEHPAKEDYEAEQMKKDEQTGEGQEIRIKMGETEPDVGVEETERSQETEDILVERGVIEDCLYLSVYLPRAPTKKMQRPLLPVLVYFPDGGFRTGSGKYDHIIPEVFMMQDIIVVLVNYRVGPFGFLNLHVEKCRGNTGLKDQVMALRWVQDNITAFGGDTKNITISGHSFGGSCVNFHLISPLSRNLFHKAIIQSGGLHCPWGYKRFLIDTCLKYKEFFRIEELMKVDAEEIMEFDEEIMESESKGGRKMAPHLGPSTECFRDNAFLPLDMPLPNLMKQAKPVPILAGIAENEGYDYENLPDEWFDAQTHKEVIKNDECFYDLLRLNLGMSEKVIRRCLHTIRERYYPNIDTLDETQIKECYGKLRSDFAFHTFYDNFKLGELGSVPIYLYEFNFSTAMNPSPAHQRLVDKNPSLGDDIPHLDDPPCIKDGNKPPADKIKLKLRTIYSFWANFCKTGIPTSALHGNVRWFPHTNEKPRYLHINDDDFKMVSGLLNKDRWNYLNEMAQENNKVLDTEVLDLDTVYSSGSRGSQPSTSQPATSIPLKLPRSTKESNFSPSNQSNIYTDVLKTLTEETLVELSDLQMTDYSGHDRFQPSSSRPATSILSETPKSAERSNFWTSTYSHNDDDDDDDDPDFRMAETLLNADGWNYLNESPQEDIDLMRTLIEFMTDRPESVSFLSSSFRPSIPHKGTPKDTERSNVHISNP